MDMKAQGLRSSKALDIGKLLTSACSASALLIDHKIYEVANSRSGQRGNVQVRHKIMPGSCC